MDKVREIIGTSFHLVAIALSLFAFIPAILLAFWTFDRKPPLSNLTGWFAHWEEGSPPIAVIAWKGDRHRLCDGISTYWLIGNRPWTLPSLDLPLPGAENQVGIPGATWYVAIPIPERALETEQASVSLRARMVWWCNPLHKYWPLALDAPDIVIPVPRKIP
jgi:hypothetical protein